MQRQKKNVSGQMGSMSLTAQSPPDSGKNHSRAFAAFAAFAGNEIIGEILS